MTRTKPYRPKIIPTPTSTDGLFDVLAYVSLAILIIVPILFIGQLPDQIPTHFNGLGEADKFGDKMSIWAMPILGLILFVVFTLLLRIPHSYNYPVPLTEQNAKQQYAIALSMMRSLRFMITALLATITIKTILIAFELSTMGIDILFWVFLLAVIIVPLYFYLEGMKAK